MKVSYKIIGWESGTGLLSVEAKCAAHPLGTRFTISLHDQSGKFIKDATRDATTAEGVRAIIEASLPVAWFEQLAAVQAAPPEDSHIRQLAVAGAVEVDRTAAQQITSQPVQPLKVGVL